MNPTEELASLTAKIPSPDQGIESAPLKAWNPQKWRECAWLIDMMEELSEFARMQDLKMTSDSLKYAKDICRADLLHKATQKPG